MKPECFCMAMNDNLLGVHQESGATHVTRQKQFGGYDSDNLDIHQNIGSSKGVKIPWIASNVSRY